MIKKIPLAQIKPNPSNPRTIRDDKFKKLVQSLLSFPDMARVRPIVVNKDMVILGGNMRYKAMQEAGWTECHVEVVDWPEDQQKEFIIKDNVGFGEWDWDELANDWSIVDLEAWGLDVPVLDEIKLDTKDDNYDTPKGGIKTDIVLGDFIEIGEHRLLCGDGTSVDDVDLLIKGESACIVFTDPMYDDDPKPIAAIFETLKTKHILIMATFKQCVSFVNLTGYKFRFDLVLNQKVPSSTMNKKVPYYLHKNIVYLTKDDSTIFSCDNAKGYFSENGYYPSVIEAPKNTSEAHGLTKNAEGIKLILSGFLFDTVLDPFIGSGSTMIAAHHLNRKCYGIEINPMYCQLIVDRMLNIDPALEVKRNGQPYKKQESNRDAEENA